MQINWKMAPVILLGLLLAGCMLDSPAAEGGSRAVRFVSGLVSPVQSRTAVNVGGATEWEANDPIGIYMMRNGSTDLSAALIPNVPYEADNGNTNVSTFTVAASAVPISYPVSTSTTVDFIAYYPYTATPVNYQIDVNVPTDQSVQTTQSGYDPLWAKADNSTNGYNNTSGTVNLDFHHALAKLSITVQSDGKVELPANMSVAIAGMNTEAQLGLANGLISGQDTPATITPLCTQDPSGTVTPGKYEAILLPITDLTGKTVVFTIDSRTYTWNLAGSFASGFEQGKQYGATITVNAKTLTVTVTNTGVTWGTGNQYPSVPGEL